MNDLYEVLQVHRRAEPEVIRAAYRALARKHHPDIGGVPERMAAINDAWAVLGEQVPRAAYDAEAKAFELERADAMAASAPSAAAASWTSAPTSTSFAPPERTGLGSRRPQEQPAAGTVLDFGRYAGWSVGSLVDHHPDYLEWLARTPLGRSLSIEIDEALARRAAESAALRSSPAAAHHRR
jgi:curved DNA-binding protein CbpA